MSKSKMTPIPGTEHAPIAGARVICPCDPHQLIEVSVVIQHRQALPMDLDSSRFVSHTEFARAYGAETAQIDKMRQFARDNKLNFLEQGDESLRRTVKLSGTVVAIERAFSVELIEYEHDNGSYRGHPGPIRMPEEYTQFVTGVFGLDTRKIAEPQFLLQSNDGAFDDRAMYTAYTPPQVARLYNFPADPNGNGQRIALIELGGGYQPADILSYFRELELQAPTVKSISVDQADNCPGVAQSADCQVMLDIEIAGAVAPGASFAVYFAPNTARGLQDALSKAVHDQLNKPSAICIGWGATECDWSGQSVQNFNQVAHEAAMLGITITTAAGNGGSASGKADGKTHVDFPASCPYVLATGGTRLLSANGMVGSESAWSGEAISGAMRGGNSSRGATGGGFSNFYAHQTYQDNHVSHAGRGVPDVVANADPETGYNILVDGEHLVVGGTSSAAALMTGLVIVLNQKLNRKLGFVNPVLYKLCRSTAFHEIATGTNGAHTATRGWNPVTGLGSPAGTELLRHLEVSAMDEEQLGMEIQMTLDTAVRSS